MSFINLLLIGTAEQISAAIADIWPALHEPIELCDGGNFRPRAHGGTLILQNAEKMPAAQQDALFAWLDDGHNTRVVTTVCVPLYPKVEAGGFQAALYYRLNTIMIDLSAEVQEEPGIGTRAAINSSWASTVPTRSS